MVFLNSGISIYHKAIVKDVANKIDPGLLTSFLQAISQFGQELTKENVSTIEFQKMKIVLCKGVYSSGAMIIKGNIPEEAKKVFSGFIFQVEASYPSYFEGEYSGLCLPEDEVDDIAIEYLKGYVREKKFYPIPDNLIESACKLKCGRSSR